MTINSKIKILALLALFSCHRNSNTKETEVTSVSEEYLKQLFLIQDTIYLGAWKNKDTSFFLREFRKIKDTKGDDFINSTNEFYERINLGFGLYDYEDWKKMSLSKQETIRNNITKSIELYLSSPLFLNNKIPWSNSIQYEFDFDKPFPESELVRLKNKFANYVCPCNFNKSEQQRINSLIKNIFLNSEVYIYKLEGTLYHNLNNKGFIGMCLILDPITNQSLINRVIDDNIKLTKFSNELIGSIKINGDNECTLCFYAFSVKK